MALRLALALTAILGPLAGPAGARSLDAIRASGEVRCGGVGRPGLAQADAAGTVRGLEAELCRAVAVALFGRQGRTTMRTYGLPADPRLREGDDIAFLTTPELLSRPIGPELGLAASVPGPTVFLIAQTVAVRVDAPAQDLADLGDALVCAEPGTPVQRNLELALAARAPRARAFMFQEDEERLDAFASGRCDAVAGEASWLAATASRPVRLLPPFAATPLLAVTPAEDARWTALVGWVLHAVIAGGDTLPLDLAGLGVAPGWQGQAAATLGSYDDMLDRLALPRGLNARWDAGGTLVPLHIE